MKNKSNKSIIQTEMKKLLISLCVLFSTVGLQAQNYYWVILTDKGNATFDPYQYFDAQAIARLTSVIPLRSTPLLPMR